MKPIVDRIRIDPRRPDAAGIRKAGDLIKRGGLVVFPTHGLYGLAVDPFNFQAVARVFDLKGRDRHKPLLVLIHDRDQLARIAPDPGPLAHRLMDRLWPGRVTFVLPALPGLAPGLTSSKGAIGVRLTAHPVAAALARAGGGVVTGTSANLSGAGGCAAVEEIDSRVLNAADLVLDAGRLAGGAGSTVVDISGAAPVILREGALSAAAFMAVYAEIQESPRT